MVPLPKPEPAYHDLPESIQKQLFKIHEHDKKGNIIYHEKDVVKLLYGLSRPVGIITVPQFPADRIDVHNGITSGVCPICNNPAQRKHLFFGKRYCVNSDCDFSKNAITGHNLIIYYLKKILNQK